MEYSLELCGAPLTASSKKPFYLDNNATTPIDPAAICAMLPYLTEHFANASSAHISGKQAEDAVRAARHAIAECLGCSLDSIYFTSGATESLNWALKCAARSQQKMGRGNHIVSSTIEHAAVYSILKALESDDFEVSLCPVDSSGFVELEALRSLIKPTTVLVTVTHANSEVGSIQPIGEIGKMVKSINPQILFHTDASQSFGKIAIQLADLNVDLFNIAGHKCYAPKGIGFLYIKPGVEIGPFIHGAGHQRNMRGGTENVPYSVALGKACEIIHSMQLPTHYGENGLHSKDVSISNIAHTRDCTRALKMSFFDHLKRRTSKTDSELAQSIRVHSNIEEPERFLSNTLSISILNASGPTIVQDVQAFMLISSGSACHSHKGDMSATLKAMGIKPEWGLGTIRISTGRFNTVEECTSAGIYLADYLIKQKHI